MILNRSTSIFCCCLYFSNPFSRQPVWASSYVKYTYCIHQLHTEEEDEERCKGREGRLVRPNETTAKKIDSASSKTILSTTFPLPSTKTTFILMTDAVFHGGLVRLESLYGGCWLQPTAVLYPARYAILTNSSIFLVPLS
jgi:hypothetical protein